MRLTESTLIWLVVAFTLALLLFAVAFVFMVNQFRNRRLNEVDNIRLIKWYSALLTEYERHMQELSAQLHNQVQQQVLLIKATCSTYLPDDKEWNMNGPFEQLVNNISRITKSMNRDYINSQNIRNLIESELQYATKNSSIHTDMDCEDVPQLDPEVKVIVFRIAREAIANAVQHAMATQLMVSITNITGIFKLCVEDDGIGINHESIYGTITHGLANMRSRASIINASLDIQSESMQGTRVILELKQ